MRDGSGDSMRDRSGKEKGLVQEATFFPLPRSPQLSAGETGAHSSLFQFLLLRNFSDSIGERSWINLIQSFTVCARKAS